MPLTVNRDFAKDYRKLLPAFAAATLLIICILVVMTSRYLGRSTLYSDALAAAEGAAMEAAAGRDVAGNDRLSRIAAYALYDSSGQILSSARISKRDALAKIAMPKTAAGAPVSLGGDTQDTASKVKTTAPAGLLGSAPAISW